MKEDFIVEDHQEDVISSDEDLIENTNSILIINNNSSKLKKLFNNKVRLSISALLLVLVFIAILIFNSNVIPKLFHNYDVFIKSEDVVYMGESLDLSITSTRDSKEKTMKTLIERSNDYSFYILNNEVTDSKFSTTIVPIQEGPGGVDVYSTLKDSKDVKNNYLVHESKNITVCPAFNTSLLTSSYLSVVKGTSYNLSIDFGEGACSENIIYKSNNDRIISVDDKGIVTGINTGSTELVISRFNKSFVVPVIVTGSRVNVTSLQTNYSKLQLMPGDTFRLNISQLPLKSTSVNVKCISSNNDVATVTNGGLIRAEMPGTTNITVSYGNIKKNVLVVVNDVGLKPAAATDIKTDNDTIVLSKGDSKRIFTLISPDNAINRLNKWDSSDYSVVPVDYNGVVYANREGTANITVTSGNIIKTVKVIVTK